MGRIFRGRRWGRVDDAQHDLETEIYGALLGSNLENKLCYGV